MNAKKSPTLQVKTSNIQVRMRRLAYKAVHVKEGSGLQLAVSFVPGNSGPWLEKAWTNSQAASLRGTLGCRDREQIASLYSAGPQVEGCSVLPETYRLPQRGCRPCLAAGLKPWEVILTLNSASVKTQDRICIINKQNLNSLF